MALQQHETYTGQKQAKSRANSDRNAARKNSVLLRKGTNNNPGSVFPGFIIKKAGHKGVEPLHTDSESAVLPLDESKITVKMDKKLIGLIAEAKK